MKAFWHSPILLLAILICSLLSRIGLYSFLQPYAIHPDSHTYHEASKKDFWHGEVDPVRTPTLPLIMKAGYGFGLNEDQVNRAVVFIQEALFIISSIVLFFTLRQVLKISWLPAAATAFYGMSPVFYNYNYAILTESLAISLGLIWLCWLINYTVKPRISLTLAINALAFILVMLRPSFIFLLPWLVLFWVGRWLFAQEKLKSNREKIFFGLGGTMTAIILVLIFMQLVQNVSGVRMISRISGLNKIHVVVQYNLHHLSSDTVLTAEIDRLLEENNGDMWPTTDFLYDHYNEQRIIDYANEVITHHPGQYGRAAIRKLIHFSGITAGSFYAHPLNPENETFFYHLIEVTWPIRLGYIYLLVLGTAIYVCWHGIRKRRLDWIMIITGTLIAGQIAIMGLGGQSEWSRIIMPALPAVLILLVVWIDKLKINWEQGNFEKIP